MTALVLASILLTIPFLVAFIGIPLWMTFARPETGADHTRARRYLRARSARTQPAARAAAARAALAPAAA
jgi:hypothetical protein